MSDAAPENGPQETPAEQQTPQDGQQQQPAQGETFDKAYVESLRKEAAKYRTEAKKAADAAEALRKSQMSETEKAIAEAETRGRQTAFTEYGTRLARAELKTAAATKGIDVAEFLEDLNLANYVGEDGEPDMKKIETTVTRFAALAAPKQGQSFDGGPRQPNQPVNMNDIIRQQAGIRAS